MTFYLWVMAVLFSLRAGMFLVYLGMGKYPRTHTPSTPDADAFGLATTVLFIVWTIILLFQRYQ